MSDELDESDVSETVKAQDAHWDAYARAFAHPFQANGLLSAFVTNPNVTGAYAEAWVRSTIRNMLGQRFRISTGTVIRSCDAIRGLHDVPQCDCIVWDPSELPAIFESGEFALVPSFAARAIIEVKRTERDAAELAEQLRERRELLPAYGPVLGVVINHPRPLFKRGECGPNWLESYRYPPPMTRYKTIEEPPMTRLLDDNNKADTRGIMTFIYFLAQVAGHND
jgi:Domain of unknown function (DUF6602)